MFNVRPMLFQVDGASSFSLFDEPAPVADDQPIEESETEAVEETETEVSEDVVEPDTDEEAPEEEVQAEPAFNDDTEIDLGEGRQAVKLAELKQGYLRQSDYTKKTQQLSDERKTFEAERAEWEPVKGMSDFLNSNPWLANQINQFVQEFSQTGAISLEDALQDAQYGQYINSLLSQANQLRKENEELKGKYGELEFTGTMRDLKGTLKDEYGDIFSDEYFTTLQERGKSEKLSTGVLKEIADAHFAKLKLEQVQSSSKKAAKNAEAQTFQKISEKRTALPSQPKKTGQVPSREKDSSPYEPVGWGEVFS